MPSIHNSSAPTTAADRVLVEAICERRIADYSLLPEADRHIDARVLQALLAGDWPELPGRCCPVRIRGARIEGPLLPLSGHAAIDGRTVLQFIGCRFDSVVDFSGVDFLSLRIVDCELPAFIGTSLGTKADLDFSGSCFTGIPEFQSELGEVGACAVHLSNARIGGHLLMDSTPGRRFSARGTIRVDGARVGGNVSLAGATLDGQGAESLSARSVTVGGNVDLVSTEAFRFEAIGEVSLVAAHVTGDLSLDSARLYTPQGRALHCEDLKVESVFVSSRSPDDPPFEASGRLNFLSATIGGSFFMTSARLDPGPDYQGLLARGGPVAVNMRQMRVSNALALSNLGWLTADQPTPSRKSKPVPIPGWFMLSGAQVSTLADDVSSGWPAAGFLDLDGMRYERTMQLGRGDLVSARARWLKLQYPGSKPDAANFRPQPYEHLAAVLRAHGQTREADAIAVEKIRARLDARVDPTWARVFPRLLMLISHHGYSSSRAVLSFLLFVVFGSILYGTAIWGFDQPFAPVQEPAQPTEYVLILEVARKQVPLGCPGLDVLHYALDAAMPVIDLGQDAHCRFVPEGRARALWLLLHSIYVIAGTALSAVVVLTLTGVMRRE